MLCTSNLSFRYGENIVLKNLNIDVKCGDLLAVIGLNGAGKSTLLKCLSKQLPIEDGSIFVQGKTIDKYSNRDYAKIVSFVPQLSAMGKVDSSVRDFIVEGRTPYLPTFAVPGQSEYLFSARIAEMVGISDLLGTNFSNLSGGQQQLVLLARALVQDTNIILLDEPMSALDLCHQASFLKLLQKLSGEGKTIIFSTHNPNHALLLKCKVLLLKDGAVLCQGNAENCLSSETIHSIYGNCVELLFCDAQTTLKIKL